MKCNKCGSPLPSSGIECKFCGALMSKEQINKNMQDGIKQDKRIELLSEKYGRENKIEYREENETNRAMYVSIIIIILFLVVVSIIMFLIKGA